MTHARAEPSGGLDRLNGLSAQEATTELMRICSARRWAAAMVAARPFSSADELQRVAAATWSSLGAEDHREAMQGHPRIGGSGGAAAEHSRREQAGMATTTPAVREAIAAGNRRYEAKFGHVFLISAAGRAPEDILAALDERLGNSPEQELRIAADEHRRITRLRLERLVG